MEKWVTLGKMGHTWKNGSHLEKLVTLEKWVTVRKMGHTWKNGSHLEKWVTVRKMGRTWKNGSHLDVKVHALHYANEPLVRDRLSFQKLLQTRQTNRNNKKLSKTGFGYD